MLNSFEDYLSGTSSSVVSPRAISADDTAIPETTEPMNMTNLFEPITVGDLQLSNRIFMSPLTRQRADEGRVPNTLMAEYYAQRATAGLIITEATSVSAQGVGYERTPGIWSEEHVEGWKLTTQAVHAAGGKIFLQLWHVGRISDPYFLDGALPVAPSAVKPAGHVSLLRPERPYVTPRELPIGELAGIVETFRVGAQNAKRAGFDGVEVHGANGYLLDQFLQDSTNIRTDSYGGPIENRARLLLEVTDACIDVWGAGRVGVHLAPRGDVSDMGDSNPGETFSYVARELGKRRIAFICSRDALDSNYLGEKLKEEFGGVYIANQGFNKQSANLALSEGKADAIAFGISFLSNPDLPRRLANDLPFNDVRLDTFFTAGATGYTDYPSIA
ncbi:hypothetical protein HDG38_006432 [Paraburkholderia sp. WSM4177]|nr:hypothetical protein [Paraburkholderia sp. WSM4177]MBB5488276.1 hypothetical protein [Paraburkholderia sp. WSM4180]